MKYFQSSRYPLELVLSENIEKQYHTHNHVSHWVLTMVISGNISAQIAGDRKVCACGDYFIVPPYIPHALSITKDAKILSLCVQSDFFKQSNLSEMKSVVGAYIDELCERNVVTNDLGQIFVGYLEHMHEMKKCNRERGTGDIEEIATMMIYNPEMILSLDELAEKVHLNKYQLLKNFKRTIGISPHQFHIQNRVRKAQKLLIGKTTILDVSIEMGFYDQSHFNKTFRKIVGVTPIEYVDSYEMLA